MKCKKCGTNIILQCCDNKPHKIDNEPVCDDCYFNELGDLIEKHPIGFHKHF